MAASRRPRTGCNRSQSPCRSATGATSLQGFGLGAEVQGLDRLAQVLAADLADPGLGEGRDELEAVRQLERRQALGP